MAAYRAISIIDVAGSPREPDHYCRRPSTLPWSQNADRVGVNRVKSLRSKRRIARAPAEAVGGVGPPARLRVGLSSLIQINDGGRAPWQGLAVSRVLHG